MISFALLATFAAHAQAIEPWRDLTPDQSRRVQELTTAFENGTIEFQYDYIENLHDGRGFTAGRVGFCTGTGDLLSLVEDFTSVKPQNPLAPFLPELRRLSQANTDAGDTDGLPGFIEAWKKTALDPAFRNAQDRAVDRLYFQPAMKHAQEWGLQSVIAKGFVYDTIIQHGEDGDPDSLVALVNHTDQNLGGNPKTGIDEKIWLRELMRIRLLDLNHPFNSSTQQAWADSVDRVECYKRILDTGNVNLDGPIHFTVYGVSFTIQ
jgi:chitosanase